MARSSETRFDGKRARYAAAVLHRYLRLKEEKDSPDLGTVRDLLQDLLHWIEWKGHEGYSSSGEALEEMAGVVVRDFPLELMELEESLHKAIDDAAEKE